MNNSHVNATSNKFSFQSLKGKSSNNEQPAHLDHEVVLFFHLTDTTYDLLVSGVHCTRIHTQRRCGDVQIHPKVIITPPTAVGGPVADAVLIYNNTEELTTVFLIGMTTRLPGQLRFNELIFFNSTKCVMNVCREFDEASCSSKEKQMIQSTTC